MRSAVVFSLFALLLFTGCGVPTAQYDLKVKEVESLTAQRSDFENQVRKQGIEIEALKKEKDTLQARIDELSSKAEKAEQLEKASQTYKDLLTKLETEIQEGQIQITEMKNRLTMTMVDKIIFPSGSAEISKKGKSVLAKVTGILKDVKDKRIQVEGHTDNVPIVSSLRKKFPTNWELSTERATQVVRYLQETGGLDPAMLSATGYSEYQPVASNDTDAGKLKNRRIEIILLPLLK